MTLPRLASFAFALLGVSLLAQSLHAAELRVPEKATAGQELTIGTSGSGEATFYLMGPSTAIKRKIKLGEDIKLKPEEVRSAGRYTAILKDGSATSAKAFFVTAAPVAELSFLARPSRVPAAAPDAINGVVFVFDLYKNLVLAPTPVRFDLTLNGSSSTTSTSSYGIAWMRSNSSRSAGAMQFVASAGPASVRRVVQQTASEPCNLRIKAQRAEKGLVVETEPVRDCSGNAIPDGTIVTFTQIGPRGRSTVDARVKRGTARAEFPGIERSTISVASGVVVGNEIHWGGQ